MNSDKQNMANIENLCDLWKNMGLQSRSPSRRSRMHVSVSWPNRCWYDWDATFNEISGIANVVGQLPEKTVFPVWKGAAGGDEVLETTLMDSGFELLFEQTAMCLELEEHEVGEHLNLDVATIQERHDIETWTAIAALSFGYEIDVSVIKRIADDPDVRLLMAYVEDRPAATAMLFKTGDTIGVHQVGVPAAYRGKGIARALMHHCIAQCVEMGGTQITLQASSAGESLYRSLGFKRQFMIKNYQRPK